MMNNVTSAPTPRLDHEKFRPTYYKIIEFISVCLFGGFAIAFLMELVVNASILSAWWIVLIALIVPVISYIGADLVSGVVHFLGDTFGSETTPIIGPNFIHPFREHHVDEKAITRHSFLEVNGTNSFLSLFLLIPMYYWLNVASSAGNFLLGELIWFLLIFIFLTNQIHGWAHLDNPPRFIKLLQKYRIILSPTHHQVHHTAPFRTYFCITSGWLNPIIGKTGIFDRIAKYSRGYKEEMKQKSRQSKI